MRAVRLKPPGGWHNPEAAEESLKARSPLYGELSFENTGNSQKAESVGREWGYRTYISGPMPGKPTPVAIWPS